MLKFMQRNSFCKLSPDELSYDSCYRRGFGSEGASEPVHVCAFSWKPSACPQAVVRVPGCHACRLCQASLPGFDLFALFAPPSAQCLSCLHVSSAYKSSSTARHANKGIRRLCNNRRRNKVSQHSWSRITTYAQYCCSHPESGIVCNDLSAVLSCCVAAARKASEQDKQALVDKVDAFIFDCDGGLTILSWYIHVT